MQTSEPGSEPNGLDELIEALRAVEQAEQEREARVRARFEAATGHPRGVAVWGDEGQLWQRLQAEDPVDHTETDRLVEAAVRAYLAADAPGRDRLRALFAESTYIHWRAGWPAGAATMRLKHHIDGSARLTEPERHDAVELALAALAFDGAGGDWRDTIVALDMLYVEALRAGVESGPCFRRAEDRARSASGAETPSSKLFAIYLAPDRAASMKRAASQPG